MRGKLDKSRIINILLVIVILITSITVPAPVTAASKYIKTNEFIKQLV